MKKYIAVLLTASVMATGTLVWAQERDSSSPGEQQKHGISSTPLATQEGIVSAVREQLSGGGIHAAI